jgi:hypothetical protein
MDPTLHAALGQWANFYLVTGTAVVAGAVTSGVGAATGALFLVAAATLLLLCIGIHNAWDTVTYLTIVAVRRRT